MRSPSFFGKLWRRLGSGVVQDVPPSLEQCEACREVDCTQERWRSCPQRLATEAALLRQRANAPVAAQSAPAEPEPGASTAEPLAGKPKPVSS